ncbi:MAG: NAD(P)-dependent oxidoreductase [Xanthobacteraceae bacterium]
MNDTPTPVAFIGLGLMGGHMAGHILAAGHPLHVYNRTRTKADALVARGAIWHDDPGAAAAASDVVITMVGLPRDVEEIYLGARGIIAEARPGAFLIDMTTSSPSLAKRIGAAARSRGLGAIDAPVSGGDVGAREAKLSIMIGGAESDVAAVMPILQLMGTNIRRQGGPGAGQHTKLANQIVIAGTMLGVAEGLAYAGRVKLDPYAVLSSIGSGAAGGFLLNMLGPRMVNRDFAAGFFVEHLIKDLSIAREEAGAAGLELKGLITALNQYTTLAERGGLRDGTQALIKVYD